MTRLIVNLIKMLLKSDFHFLIGFIIGKGHKFGIAFMSSKRMKFSKRRKSISALVFLIQGKILSMNP
jgi:hypothetical protein